MVNELGKGFPKSEDRENFSGFPKARNILPEDHFYPSRLDWRIYQPELILNYAESFNRKDPAVVTTPGSIAGSNKYNQGVLAPNGKIFCMPNTVATVLVIDTKDDSLVTLSPGLDATVAKYRCGVLALNGFIYGIPNGASQIMKINPNNNVITFFGSFGAVASKWWGGCLAPNGKIYCPPNAESSILVIDPTNDSTYRFGSFTTEGTAKWNSAVLATNGKIYCSNNSATRILVIDPSNDSWYTIPSRSTGFLGSCIYTDGSLYFFGSSAGTMIMKVDTTTDISSVAVSYAAGTYGCWSPTLSPDGKIYGAQVNVAGIFRFDPKTGIADKTIVDIGTSNKNTGNTLAPNGFIYGIPFNRATLIKIGTAFPIDANLPLCRHINNF